jgi:hypothetical protein
MEAVLVEIKAEDIIPDPGVIAGLAGVNPENIPEPYNTIIRKEIDYTANYTNIRGGYIVSENISLSTADGSFKFGDIDFYPGKRIVDYLTGSEKLALFVCTAGEEVTLRSRQMMKSGYMVEGYIIDSLGSLLVDAATDIIIQKLRNEINPEALKVTNRYSPGHCNWRLDEQKKLFSCFPEGFCGISLSESSLMIPLKSVSGVAGIGANVGFSRFICDDCDISNCIFRDINMLKVNR